MILPFHAPVRVENADFALELVPPGFGPQLAFPKSLGSNVVDRLFRRTREFLTAYDPDRHLIEIYPTILFDGKQQERRRWLGRGPAWSLYSTPAKAVYVPGAFALRTLCGPRNLYSGEIVFLRKNGSKEAVPLTDVVPVRRSRIDAAGRAALVLRGKSEREIKKTSLVEIVHLDFGSVEDRVWFCVVAIMSNCLGRTGSCRSRVFANTGESGEKDWLGTRGQESTNQAALNFVQNDGVSRVTITKVTHEYDTE